ncbi:AraC family transcriptional regulator [Noviherbaspirillum sedimenti]|uniref:AraC family transcriptional regulator n=1 Tax=Noviherbaspirillum sedimenti TaxID=2320865 RepID=A0A3A3FZ80_9BURK|nr:AraC family transcriptional regulator [Noviherbaspirillum sedimenti]RJG00665.1 AraC family transcriptional regulator [Noviherbaspirillum sedimenti]
MQTISNFLVSEPSSAPAQVRPGKGKNFADHAVRVLRAGARSRIRLVDCLAAAGVALPAQDASEDNESILQALARSFISQQECSRLLNSIKEALNDECYGLCAHPCRRGTFAFAVEMALRSDTLTGAVDVFFRFYGVVTEDLYFEKVVVGDDVELRVSLNQPELDPDGILCDYWLVSLHLLLSWMAGYMFPVKRVDMTLDQASLNGCLSPFLRGECRTGQTQNALVFSRKYLTLPVIRTLAELQEHLALLALGVPQWPKSSPGWSSRVRAVLRQSLSQRLHWPSQDEVCRDLGVTSQTLRRHLRSEGAIYQALSDELRRDLAIEKLCLQRMPVAEVAAQLGYAEPRSFSRAFKQWTQMSPSTYQRRREKT